MVGPAWRRLLADLTELTNLTAAFGEALASSRTRGGEYLKKEGFIAEIRRQRGRAAYAVKLAQ